VNLISPNGKIIAVDFDGTIVEHKYPKIGKEMYFAFDALKVLRSKGHRLILWTYRTGKELDAAIAYCHKNGVVFYAVNENYPGETANGNFSRKLRADIFIDDRNVGGFLGWEEILYRLHPNGDAFDHVLKNRKAHRNTRKIFKRLRFW
jgi:hypothetical protein